MTVDLFAVDGSGGGGRSERRRIYSRWTAAEIGGVNEGGRVLGETRLSTLNRQGNDVGSQYRLGIYYYSENQAKLARESLGSKQKEVKKKIVTEIVLAKSLYRAEEYNQQYLEKGGRNGSKQPAAKGCNYPIRCYEAVELELRKVLAENAARYICCYMFPLHIWVESRSFDERRLEVFALITERCCTRNFSYDLPRVRERT